MKQQGRTGFRYMFEHGAPYTPPRVAPPFVPDRNFDGESIYGLPEIETVGLADVAPSSSPLVPEPFAWTKKKARQPRFKGRGITQL